MKVARQIVVFDAADLDVEATFWAATPRRHCSSGLARDGTPQQIHLDLWGRHLEAAHGEAMSPGARLLKPADDPQEDEVFQVYADPAGLPFCLCWRGR